MELNIVTILILKDERKRAQQDVKNKPIYSKE